MTAGTSEDGFHVARWVDVFGGFVSRRQRLWTWLGDQETRFLSDEIALREIEKPIYVSGLARSGSTILLEALARHPDVATQRYKDYPPIFTPVLWNRFLDRTPQRPAEAAERTHKDGILVTPESPEAFEEVLWMASFPDLHDPMTNAVLDGGTSHPEFERFYKNHIRKLLLVRRGARYLSKGNYNLTRLEYLLKLFPDARFVIPVRDPCWHVASLMKQHALFSEGQRRNPTALRHLQRVGHFEFGLDRRPINVGDRTRVAEVLDLWRRGEEVEGWARYWSQLHDHIADRLDANGALRRAALVVRFEVLCRAPRDTLGAIFEHCRLAGPETLVEEFAGKIRFPSYYRPKFTAQELRVIDRATRETALRFGYDERAALDSSPSQVA